MHTVYTNHPNDSLRSMAVLSGARLSREAARKIKTRPNLPAVSLPSPTLITLGAQKPPCYAVYPNENLVDKHKTI